MAKLNKQDEIVAMFDAIAGSYDVANRVLSAGVDIAWRKEACRLALDLVEKRSPLRMSEQSSAESPTSRHCETSRSESSHCSINSATEGDALNVSEESASGLSSGSPCCVTARNDDVSCNDGVGENPPPQTAPDSTDPLNIIDIASGTGDMVLHWAAEAKKRNIPTQFSAIDPSVEMLKIGEKKINEAGISAKFITAKAQNLPLDSSLADIISIAYGLRNVTDLDAALAEFFRLLKPGGVLVILEFTRNDRPKLLDRLARLYTTRILPIIGGLISRNYAAYKYLPNSIDSFESLDSLCAKLRAAGLTPHTTKTYPANISSLIIAVKNQ